MIVRNEIPPRGAPGRGGWGSVMQRRGAQRADLHTSPLRCYMSQSVTEGLLLFKCRAESHCWHFSSCCDEGRWVFEHISAAEVASSRHHATVFEPNQSYFFP